VTFRVFKVSKHRYTALAAAIVFFAASSAYFFSKPQHAAAAVTTVGSNTNNGLLGSGSNMVINKVSGVQTDDLMIVTTGFNGAGVSGPTWTLPSGWTQYHQNAQNSINSTLFYKIAGGSEPSSYTFNPTQSGSIDGAWGMIAIRGADTSTPLLGVSADFQNSGGTSSFTANSVSWAGAANAVSLIHATYQTGTTTVTWPSGWNVSPDGFAADDTGIGGGQAVIVGGNLTIQSGVTSLASKTVTLGANRIGNANQYAIKTAGSAPAAPTLSAPSSGATGVSTAPQFQLSTTDADGDYLRYEIQVCSTSNCSSVVRTVCQDSNLPNSCTGSQTGWSGQNQQSTTAYTGSATLASSTLATYSYQTPSLSANTQYWWRAYAIDPGGSNTSSSVSSIFTFTTSQAPAAPNLVYPGSGASAVSNLPIFQLRTTDAENDYLQYFIQIYDATTCGGSQVGSNIDQSVSQTGWQSQDANTSTAYVGSSTIGSSTIARYQYNGTALTNNHVYSWRAKAIDPAGSNTFSSLTSCSDFTTGTAAVEINGGTQINGGTTIQ
jgi:hypothetical protein